MCGRFFLTTPAEVVAEMFDLVEPPPLAPRYNIAPTQPAPVVWFDQDRGRRRFDLMHWGLIPRWAKDASIGSRMINALAETAAGKPSFRAAFKYRRCLIVADGFYEWQKLPDGKQPFCIRMNDGGPFALAGLWEHWAEPGGSEIDSCTILTTEPNDLLKQIHNRMPVILRRDDYARWLDPRNQGDAVVTGLLRPYDAEAMTAYRVSKHVNRPANDDPGCIKPLE